MKATVMRSYSAIKSTLGVLTIAMALGAGIPGASAQTASEQAAAQARAAQITIQNQAIQQGIQQREIFQLQQQFNREQDRRIVPQQQPQVPVMKPGCPPIGSGSYSGSCR
ncbi:hypothetical protein D3Y55_09755 [Mesorhizobium sp. DCY119]|nr:hypothetical protein D3Y55_09755 [Mesorhizobium sp. DCY119]